MKDEKVLLVGFCGKMGSGKDYMGSYVANLLDKNPVHYSFATPLKDEVNVYLELIRGGTHEYELMKILNMSEEELRQAQSIIDVNTIKSDHTFHSRTRNPEIRRLLQFWGSDLRRKQDKDYWVDKAKEAIKEHNSRGEFVFVTDARFINEFQAIKELGGKLVYLNVSKEERIKRISSRDGIVPTRDALDHMSERDCDLYTDYDLELKTDGLQIHETQALLKDYFLG